MHMILFLRSLIFNLVFYIWTVVIMAMAFPALLFSSDRAILRFMAMWGEVTNKLLWWICRIGVEIRGVENIPHSGCYIVAAKHQSAWDVLAYNRNLGVPAIVMKREILWIPIAGAYAHRMKMIPVNRSSKNAAAQMVEASKGAVLAGRPILIFPQGTRVPARSRLPYRGGIGALYAGLGLPVVPAAVNSGLFWPRRKFLRYPGTIILEFLPPIMPGLSRDEFMTRLESEIEATTERLESEADQMAIKAAV